ncbi:MAG TPA: C4-type zinc ribbon domain-containing protein [Chloroflexia bacterium]|nr:C4-type zinc ribbon domain-containing protein [Chloroflexia bacterium]
MSRTGQLYDLQQIDSALDSRVARMRQIDQQMVDSPELIAARNAHQEAASYHSDLQARLKQASHEVEDTSNRIRIQDKRLYDGSIKNPKELGQVQDEVAHLKSRLKTQEDAAIEAMMQAEAADDQLQARAADLEEATSEWQKFQAGLAEEKDTLLQQAKVLQLKRQRAIAELPWADLQTYERLRRGKGGVAIAGVREGLCGGCGVSVPANILHQARAGTDLVSCPTCGRILYPVGQIKFAEFDHDLDNINR